MNLGKVKVIQSCLTLCDPMHCIVHGILQARILECVAFPSPGDLSNPETKPRSPALQADCLLAEPQGKPKNTGVGSLSLLQWIFLTQESNQGLLHYRWILYQLSYQGSCHYVVYLELIKYTMPTILQFLKRKDEVRSRWIVIFKNVHALHKQLKCPSRPLQEVPSLIPVWETKIPDATQSSQKNKA